MSEPTSAPANTPVIARADFQYRWRVYAIFLVMFGYGLLSIRDGFYKWPQENVRNQEMIRRHEKPSEADHNDAAILINKVLGVLLPAISLPLFIWLMYRSRGAYRLEENTLHLPGLAPIPLDKIQALDKSRWEKKGIAVVEYHDGAGSTQTATLRDMVYERRTTDQIVDRIEKSLGATPTPTPPNEGA